MQLNANIVSSTVNTLLHVMGQKRPTPGKNLYSWADGLFFKKVISAPLLHSLKAIIACSNLDRPTLLQINNARTKSAARKFAQSNPVTERTLRRHISDLETMELIGVTRTRDKRRNSRNAYRINAPEPKLSCRSEDIMSASITLATSSNYNNTKSEVSREKKAKQLDLGFDEKQLAILATLLSWSTWKGRAVRWLQQHTARELQEAISYVDSKPRKDRGRYMNKVINSLEENKRAKSTVKNTMPAARKIEIPEHIIDREAVTRLDRKGITDPRTTGRRVDYDVCKQYDVALNDERRIVRAHMEHSYAKKDL